MEMKYIYRAISCIHTEAITIQCLRRDLPCSLIGKLACMRSNTAIVRCGALVNKICIHNNPNTWNEL